MGRIKDLFIELNNLERVFVDFLAELFKRYGYCIVHGDGGAMDETQADLIITRSSETKPIVVELKVHRSERVPVPLIRNAYSQLNALVSKANADHGILIIPQRLVHSHDDQIRGRNELWDLTKLVDMTAPHPDLAADLAELIRALQVGAQKWPDDAPSSLEVRAEDAAELPPPGAGAEIANALDALEAGREDGVATDFEKLCGRALKLLFDTDFSGWKSQSPVGERFQRLDLIARLVSRDNYFWTTLAADFRTRYVIFEFKNYADPITQDQIYTTEKYLFTNALRSVAIIIARNGANANAHRAMQGALREQGKLILCITMAELCRLLRGYDVGNDPTSLLIERLDEMLMTITR